MRYLRHTGLAVALSVMTVASAAAQSTDDSSRPYRGLFGGAEPFSSRGQSLDLSLSGFGGWDQPDDVPLQPQLNDNADRVEMEGPFGGSSASIVYTRPGENLNVRAFGSGFGGYFPDNNEPWYTSSAAGVSADGGIDLSGRTRLRLSQAAAWATDYRIGYMSGGTPGTDIPSGSGNTGFDNSLERAPSISSQSTVDLSHRFSQKATLTGGYGYHYVHFFENASGSQYPDGRDHDARIRYEYRVAQYLGLRAGYGYRYSPARVESEDDLTFHDIDVGVNFGRTLSFSRRTQFSFNTGSTVTASADTNAADSTFTDPRFFVVGAASLVHEIGRSWTTRANYSRSVWYREGFRQPSLTDQASAGVGGLLGRRTDVSGGIYWSTEAIGLEERNYHSWYGSAQIRTAITRNLAVYANYYYYFYDFGADVPLPTGFARQIDRHGVRVGLTTWVPLWASRGTP